MGMQNAEFRIQNSEFRMFAEPHNPKSKIQNLKLFPVPQNYLDRLQGLVIVIAHEIIICFIMFAILPVNIDKLLCQL
jgi:hypothetical protein